MPTYEYRCKECGEHLEVVQSFTDDALTDCPSCGAEGQLRKVFGNIGITFKGSGFYKNDSRSGGGSKTASGSSGGDSGSSSGDSASKPAGDAGSKSDSSPSKSDSGSTSSATTSDTKAAAS